MYGVVYDCLAEVERQLPMLVNRFHFKTLRIDGEDYHNLLQASDSAVLAMDFLLCSLNEIGSMSFLRSERILNSYLGRNHLQDSEKDAYH